MSDCSAEASVSGQLLLYRLLHSYDSDDLTVVEGDNWPSEPKRRLPGVRYHTVSYQPWRFRTRLHRYWNTFLIWGIRRWVKWAIALAKEQRVEAILTVAHGHLWIVAAAVAQRLDIPLHLIIHDDWPMLTPVAPGLQFSLHRRLRRIYNQAASRLCVSPFMEAEYHRRYGCHGTVLLPSRSEDMPAGLVQVRDRQSRFTLAFAGSLPNSDYPVRLRGAADAVARIGGILDVYTNATPARLAANGLERPDIRHGGFMPSRQLIERIAATADALFLPMSFRSEDRTTMEVAFPSKLADYTAAGLPILVWGPAYSAAARWSAENPGVTLCVTEPDADQLAAAVRQLAEDTNLRRQLATEAVAVGNRQFAFTVAAQVFQRSLQQGRDS